MLKKIVKCKITLTDLQNIYCTGGQYYIKILFYESDENNLENNNPIITKEKKV